MPKKAVVIYLLAGLVGAALFVFFTFPRTKEEIPTSNNQRPYPSSPGPNGVPETVPHPNTPAAPHGPSLRVMAWATAKEALALQEQADAFESASGMSVSLVIENDEATYRHDLLPALNSDTPPDLCLVGARDFSGLDPARDFTALSAKMDKEISPRSVAAFTVGGKVRAIPDEFSVDLLFYNPHQFDVAGIGYPDRHWTWDIMEAITRALVTLKLKNDAGQPVYPLELPANFDFWNILCTQAGHPALDRDNWHLADADGRDSQLRGLDLIHEFFRELSVTAPVDKANATPGRFFAQQRAALLIGPSELASTLPKFHFGMTLLPSDVARASLARVNGWAVTASCARPEEARKLADFLGAKPVHAGWSSVRKPAEGGLCYEALEQSLLPRLEPKTARLAQLLDEQINLFASSQDDKSSANLYAEIQAEYHAGYAPKAAPKALNLNKADGVEIRGL